MDLEQVLRKVVSCCEGVLLLSQQYPWYDTTITVLYIVEFLPVVVSCQPPAS